MLRLCVQAASMRPSHVSLAAFAAATLAMSSLAFAAIPPHKVLFDATKAQMAGNADWVIDADLHTIGTGSGGAMVVGAGSESNPQRVPTPALTQTAAATAPETTWQGALSAFAIALVARGESVETLPPVGGRITYRDSTNTQDLSNYSVFVVDEPNIAFAPAEQSAIIAWVRDGGGLFLISDHAVSDRNNDGIDSVGVWNALLQTAVSAGAPFGISVNSDNVSPSSTNIDTATTNPITNGPAGTVTQAVYHNGATLSINTAQNPSARIAAWSTATRATNNAMIAFSSVGLGRVVAIGDSSMLDDGTGDPGDSLFNDWGTSPGSSNPHIAINAVLWLDHPPVTCRADFNAVNGVSVQDIFDFLAAWFASDPRADFNGASGISVQDIFDFLAAWFAGC